MMSSGCLSHQTPGRRRRLGPVLALTAAFVATCWAAPAAPAEAQSPGPSSGLGVTPVATAQRRGPIDLSAPLPVATLVPTVPPPTATIAVLPATLTPTPITPTSTPPPTATSLPTATPVVVAVLPTEAPASEAPATAVPVAQPTEEPAAAPAPHPPINARLPAAPQAAPPRSYVVNLPQSAGWLDDMLLWLGVPSRSQYDGTAYASANCGPSALGMILEAYGLYMSTADIRAYANYLQGTYGYDDGIALDHLAEIARLAGLKPVGLYGSGGYRRWTVDDVRDQVLAGHPVIVLTKYRLLPGNGGYGGNVNHYVVISGLLDDDFLYNDSAFGGGGGRGLVISAAQLEAAWATADIPRHAVAFALGEQSYGLLSVDASRFGRGAGSIGAGDAPGRAAAPPDPLAGVPNNRFDRREAARSRLVAGPDTLSTGPPARLRDDPAAQARESLLAEPAGGSSLLDTPFLGGTAAFGAAPAAVVPLPTPDDLPLDAPTARDEPSLAPGSLLLLVGGIGGLYLLLVGQAAWSWRGRRAQRR